ncbi:Opacity-associated protein A domain protein [Rahnella sp. SAP-1]|uniref:Opacity-associated protein A domain protein n=1 Tax=Rouxiella aceris TaxID=2703884 RepID=A0A848MEP8_9GAMM|nr:LysM-like peptidoglycan-binding domain-containing protein [Rouxiella aceris]NMP25876.1 Opacity-associated protein A domain protein [Rouxiella aceris]
MGQFTPRRRKATRIFQPMLRSWIATTMQRPLRKKPPETTEQDEVETAEVSSPHRVRGKASTLFERIWHLSDDFHWMEPLPYFHRRWIIISLLLVVIAILWPYSPENTYAPSDQTSSVPMQADLRNEQGRTTQLAQPQPDQSQRVQSQPASPPATSDQGSWKSYHIQSGQTLAQLFRDNNLMVNDVFAMAQVEGDDKPLSNLHTGQEVKIQRNAQGVVTSLEVINDQNTAIRFTRQADGSYQRSR